MQVEEQEKLQARVVLLEKRLKAAESQCQATTKEIWQMEVELARMEERLQEAERASGPATEALDPARLQAVEAELAEARAAEERLHLQVEELSARNGQLSERLEQSVIDVGNVPELQARLEDLQAERLSLMAGMAERLEQAQDQQERVLKELEELRQRFEELVAESHLLREHKQRLEEECEGLRRQLAEAGEPGSRSGAGDLQRQLGFQQERAELLQQRLDQVQQRLELSEEKASLYQQKSQETDSRVQQYQHEAQTLRERLERIEGRAREADQIFAAAEEERRQAELKSQESWQRVRDAEMRANQAVVENKKLADRLAEHEKRAQESDRETQRLAFQDVLTGLPNQNLIAQYLEFTVKQCVRYRRVAALMVVDIDRFKVFNEAMGTKAGDELLVKVAERLQQAIRETDSLGRRGEDEFILLLSELNVGEYPTAEARLRAIHQHVEVVANRVNQMMASPFLVQGQKFTLEVSIGIAICPDDGETPQALLDNADTAMYHVKETGRNRHQFYTHDLRRRQEKRLTLDMQLRSALERGEFEVRYQPVVSLAKGKGTMVGVESLLRWNHRIDGVVGPEYFLPAAEESGMIIPIGQWVLAQTCAQMREWLNFGLRIFASVNLSKRQLLQSDLVDLVARELTKYGIPPEALYVEIAEGFNTFNPELMDQVINRLGGSGIRIAIDDFGVGYSSLSRLNLNYTRVLKIDRSIVEGCPHDRQSSTVCIAAINLASSLGLLSLAEGVENANQVKFLTKYGCALAQGYYFAEPCPAAEITNFHRTKKVWKV